MNRPKTPLLNSSIHKFDFNIPLVKTTTKF